MEIAKTELAAVREAATKGELEIKDLKELELALVGGGLGDITLG